MVRFRKLRLLYLGFCGIALWLGANPIYSAPPWFARVWQVDDGLPGDNVTGIAQTRDGYLWIATQTGLARFDGVRIKNIRIRGERPQPIIRAMCRDNSDRLWLALEGGTVVRWTPTDTRVFRAVDGLPRAQPSAITHEGDTAICVAYLDGTVCRIADDVVSRIVEPESAGANVASSLTRDTQGRVWFARGGQVGVLTNGIFKNLLSRGERYVQVQGARDGGVWICAGDRLLKHQAESGAIEVARIVADTSIVRPLALLEDSSGAVWIGTSAAGLFRYDGKTITKVETSHGRIQTIIEDREGNIWVGTEGGGLNRLRLQVVELQGKEAGLPFDTVRSVCEDAAGTIWVVTQSGDVATSDGRSWKVISSTDLWPGGQATCVAGDTNGTVYIGTYSRGVYRWSDGQFISALRRSDGLTNLSIRSLLVDRGGNLWIAFSSGDVLQRYRAGEFQNYALPAGSRAVRTMTEDASGRIWLGNLDAQLLRVEAGSIVDETPQTLQPYRPIRCLVGTADGSLWIGYSTSGVGRWKDGSFSRVGLDQGLQDGSICSLMPDNSGRMWVASDHGVFRVGLNELAAAADRNAIKVQCTRYGRDEGLPSLQGYYGYSPGAAVCRDGRILLPTHSGLVIAHPGRVRDFTVPPPVIIESVLVDNLAVSNTQAELPAGHHKVEFIFTAPSFIEAEKVQLRYRLEGWDDNWAEVEPGGERRAVYSRLPAGEYRFQVAAGNSAGNWNETGAVVTFKVQEFFWQPWKIVTLAVILLTPVSFAVARYILVRRLRIRVERLERENALQRERARIAQDIHDDIGAHMTRISLLTDLTERHLDQPGQAAKHVAQIARISRSAIKALDEIVWAANPRNDTVSDLLDYAGQYAVDFLQLANIRCRVDFPTGIPPTVLSGEMRHGLFLSVKEALHNVVKHAHATEVWLRVKLGGDSLELVIEDNGRGFAAAPDDALADGLRNMRERLAELGGKCSIESRPGAGTCIRFELTLRKHD